MTTKGITSPAPNSANWDVPLNANFAAIEKAFGDSVNVTSTAGTVTLDANQVGHMCLRCTGALTADLTLRVPSGTAGQWVVVNATTDATPGTLRTLSITSVAGGTPIVIARGSARSVYADGTINGVIFADTINIPGADNQIVYNDNGVLAGSSNLTFDGAAVSVGKPTSITITGASWTSGTATVTFSADQAIPVGSIVSITGVNPVGYNGSWVTTGTAITTQVQFAVAVNPGSYISGGSLRYGNLNLGGSMIGGIASQELAEAGTNDTTIMTPLRVAQAARPVSATAVVATSGTAIDFTVIPSWAKRVSVMFSGVSTNGSSPVIIQIGTSSGFLTSGYVGSGSVITTAVSSSSFTTGFATGAGTISTATTRNGLYTISNINGNSWVMSGSSARGDIAAMDISAGAATLAATLDRVRVTTVSGTQTFDAGTINIMWE